MARARNIKPSFFINEELVECDFSARLLFIGLWTLADREGKLEDRPKKIKMALFPSDNINVDGLLNELNKRGFIERYEVEGSQYIQVVAFKKHQNPHRDEKPSIIPDCIKHCASTVQAPCKEQLSTVAIGLNPDSFNPITESPLLIPDLLIPEVCAEKTLAPKQTGKSLPKDWVLPKTWGEWALSERPEFTKEQIRKISESFKDHWLSTANQAKSKRADWEATWRNWVRNQKIFKSNHAPPDKSAFQQSTTDAAYEKLFGKMLIEKEVQDATDRV